MKNNRITLLLMSQKGLEVLNAILGGLGVHMIEKVISAREKNIVCDYFDEIEQTCQKHQIPFFERSELTDIRTEYALAISWRWLIQPGDARLIVLHDSLLPKYRGFAPLVNALINGEKEVGVTALISSNEYDTGDIIAQKKITINYPITIQKAIDSICGLYSSIALEILGKINHGHPIESTPQNEKEATYSLWLNDDDYFIDWAQDASVIKRFIDAVGHPYSGAQTWDGEKKYLINDSFVEEDVTIEKRHPGKIIFIKENEPVVVCGIGLLRLKNVTDENGNSLLPLKKFRIRFCKP